MTNTRTKASTKTSNKYHHGDLYSTLIETATAMVNEHGIDGLSLRKLAERIGVSRTAAYHHFTDKNALLCAIATQGFNQWQDISEAILNNAKLSNEERYRQFIFAYLHFATDKPALYELMFGSTIWKNHQSTEDLKNVAFASFQYQVDMTKAWQQQKLLPEEENSLRLSQVMWATLHGMAKLLIDGIYADLSHLDEMCECMVRLYLSQRS